MSAHSQLPKAKLIETAAELIYRQGWNATGINQILGDAEVPKGSFYYYFQSKEDLGVAIVQFHAQRLSEAYERTLLNSKLRGCEALETFFEDQLESHRRVEWRFGCPVGSFSNEVAATSEKIAMACREAMSQLVAALKIAVERGQADGTIRRDRASEELALLAASLWQGGLLYMKTLRSEQPARSAAASICHALLEA